MKNLFLLSLGLLLFSSCKRDWVCDCSFTVTDLTGQIPPNTYEARIPIDNATRADARKQCNDVYCVGTKDDLCNTQPYQGFHYSNCSATVH